MAPTNLFSADLIPLQIQAELPEGYVIRPLERDDFRRGHLESLRHLTDTGEISEEEWIERFDWMLDCKGTYYIVVIAKEANGAGKEIVASATLVAEKKLYVRSNEPVRNTSSIEIRRCKFPLYVAMPGTSTF